MCKDTTVSGDTAQAEVLDLQENLENPTAILTPTPPVLEGAIRLLRAGQHGISAAEFQHLAFPGTLTGKRALPSKEWTTGKGLR